jgi:hypothetical protein
MNIETKNTGHLDALSDSHSFRRNPIHWSIFYGTSLATIIMFIILCALAAWSISIGQQITSVVQQSTEILSDIHVMLPEISNSIRILQLICKHDNFTSRYGDICN